MKKMVISIVIFAVLAAALASAGFVYAQSTNPPTQTPGSGFGQGGMMGGRGGMRGGMMGQAAAGADLDGPMHDQMIAAFAEKLGVSVEDLDARLAKGETMADIASSKGLSADQFTTLMADARAQALDQAVKDGSLTQAQADWMKQRGAGMMAGGRGMRAGRGAGQGQFGNPDCPYFQDQQ